MAMNKFLMESGWKALTQKFKLKDTTLQQALAAYAKLEEEKYVDRVKALEHITQVANTVKKTKEVLALGDVGKYVAEVVKADEAETKLVKAAAVQAGIEGTKKAAEMTKAAIAALPPKADPKMLETVYQIGVNDGENEEKSVRSLFAKAPAFQKKYDEGYQWGAMIAEKIRAKGPQEPQTSMGPISEEQEKRDNEYTRRRAARKEFIQYMNDQWSTVLPEDM
jgi:hypothetical protein